ncbi:helix-turn-helix transcriptional regulator [Raoultibacter phocaeensis]|uniref:helix-turn-helix transcriptional regulator n=1 Tax=Raoultibacter phocaeensis TaxID=2479841 RepID=UPI00111A2BC4|nr:LuxR C-terminal-related transcriptional regulator [Raoultibacter phocaeensis]
MSSHEAEARESNPSDSTHFVAEIANARWIRTFGALMLVFLGTWLLNQYIFPRFTLVYGMAREFATLGSCCVYLTVAVASSLRPTLFRPDRLAALAVALLAVGLSLIAMGLLTENPALLACGGFLMSPGRGLISIYACITLISLETRASAVCIAGSLALAYLMRGVFVALPDGFGIASFALAPLVTLALAYPLASEILNRIRSNPSAATLALTEPRSFLSYSHILFISFFIFRIAYGFSLMFGVSEGVPPFTILAFLPLAVVALQAFIAGRAAPADILYQVASLFVLAGFLSVLVPQLSGTPAPNVLLAAGADCFSVLVYYALAAIGRRNPLHALPIFAWGQFATSAGTLVGTSLGHLTNGLLIADPILVPGTVVLVVLAFSAFNLLVLRTFSFEKTIEGVEAVPVFERIEDPGSEQTDAIEAQCARIAERFALTERETDVFNLLAKGRNVPFIEEELIISRNTIKTHIKHIYQKMDLHSQQELIDMVETY